MHIDICNEEIHAVKFCAQAGMNDPVSELRPTSPALRVMRLRRTVISVVSLNELRAAIDKRELKPATCRLENWNCRSTLFEQGVSGGFNPGLAQFGDARHQRRTDRPKP